MNMRSDVKHRALVCAAVIYYARPFGGNEHPNPKRRPPDAAASLVEVTGDELSQIIPDPTHRALHDELIAIRNKVVAHAESEFFPVTVTHYAQYLSSTDPTQRSAGFGFDYQRPLLAINLDAMKANAWALRAHVHSRSMALLAQIRGAAGAT